MKNKDTQQETPEKAKNKKLYYIIVAACALVLIAAIVFTVVMVTQDNAVTIENPDPDDGKDPDEEPGDDDDEDKPSDNETVFSMPVDGGTVSATFSFWYNSTLNRYNLHEGIDFKAEAGTEVSAAYAGTVTEVGDTLLEGGKVVISHGDGLTTEFASIDVASTLKVGDKVEQGTLLGTVSAAADVMGNEYNEGAHLHLGVFENAESLDPTTYLEIDEK